MPTRSPRILTRFGLSACLTLLACEPDPVSLRVDVSPGVESGDFLAAPPVARFVVQARDHTGAALAAAEAPPGGGFTLGEFPLSTLMSFDVTGFGDADQILARGRSLAVIPSALATPVLPVFTQRVDRFSRPPGELPEALTDVRLIATGSRYLMLLPRSSDREPRAWFYDLLALGFSGPLALPRFASSVASDEFGESILVIDEQGASWVDFSAGTTDSANLPSGLDSWADVAGGDTVRGDAAQYVVAATRKATPSDVVLVVNGDRSLKVARLQAARSGAAAAWLSGQGLVVAGGHDSEVGVEVLRADSSQASPLPFPADATTGASLVPSATAERMVLLGGQNGGMAASTREIALDCLSACAVQFVEPAIDLVLVDSQAFALPGGRALLSGHTAEGVRRSFDVVLGSDAQERPLREARLGSDIAAGPNGSLFVGGGRSSDGEAVLSIERLWVD